MVLISDINELKASIISIGRLLWDKDLVGGFNGNISVRLNDRQFLITGRGTCLGFLREDEIVVMDKDGNSNGPREASSEKRLHLEIYSSFKDIKAVIHTHTTYTNAFFLTNEVFKPATLEAEYVLGEVYGVDQTTINVADPKVVIDRLEKNRLVALRRHGVVAIGDDLFQCFVKIQGLEEQIKMQAVAALLARIKS